MFTETWPWILTSISEMSGVNKGVSVLSLQRELERCVFSQGHWEFYLT